MDIIASIKWLEEHEYHWCFKSRHGEVFGEAWKSDGNHTYSEGGENIQDVAHVLVIMIKTLDEEIKKECDKSEN